MKALSMTFMLLGSAGLCYKAHACSISSSPPSGTPAYTVHLNVYPEAIIPATNSCPYGYNYNVRMRYDVSFTGAGAPSSLYTLQGRVQCGSTNIFFDLPNSGGSGTVVSSNAWTSMTNCASVTPASLGCANVYIEIEGPYLSARTVLCTYSTLPIELLSFEVDESRSGALLRWTTASEHHNDHFVLERSAEGHEFVELLRMNGAGDSQSERDYEALDDAPLPGVSYYRLRQVDSDGTSTVSEVIPLKRVQRSGLVLCPNPMESGLLQLPESAVGVPVEIFDSMGGRVFISRSAQRYHDLSGLPSGSYLVRCGEAHEARTAILVRP